MKNIFEHFQEIGKIEKLLVLGKGPSFSKINNYPIKEYRTVSLNHTIREIVVDYAHMIDFDVFEDCSEAINKNANYLIMPMHPHFIQNTSKKTLVDLIEENNVLKTISEEGRLLWYNLSISKKRYGDFPVVSAKYFSSEAVFDMFAKSGVKQFFTLGIDGGKSYSSNFKDLSGKTLLLNGQPSYNLQFKEIERIIMNSDAKLNKLDEEYPIKVYVATQEGQMLATKILEYSIKKRTDKPVEVYPMHLGGIEYREPKNPSNRQRTPFSFQRFLIPQLNGYKGKAIYVDSDMQVFKDINDLWSIPMEDHDLLTVVPADGEGRRLQFSVMLMDCSKLDWKIDEIIDKLDSGELDYKQLMHDMKLAKSIGVKIPKEWNCLEWYEEGVTALWHCTDMETQPWVNRGNPNCNIWMQDLFDAIDEGFVTIDYIKDHIEKGWLRPSLMYQIEHRVLDSLTLPPEAVALDDGYKAPFEGLLHFNSRPYDNIPQRVIMKSKKILRTLKKKFKVGS